MIFQEIHLKKYYSVIENDPVLKLYNFEDSDIKFESKNVMLIIPGGGYDFVSYREAEPLVLTYALKGYACAVLFYSVKKAYPVPQLEVLCAVDFIKRHAKEYKFLDKLGLIGFSAGGHLAGSYGYKYKELAKIYGFKDYNYRPDVICLSYPVVVMNEKTHLGTKMNITNGGDIKLCNELSIEKNIPDDYPPTFLWATSEDNCVPVENTIILDKVLLEKGIRHETHIYKHGDHGLSIGTKLVNFYENEEVKVWTDEFARFAREIIYEEIPDPITYSYFRDHHELEYVFYPFDKKLYDNKKPCKGYGLIRYGEGSIYEGDIFFDGKSYHKLGFGYQDFTTSSIGYINEITQQKIYRFYGKFDYRKTNWIYGNGVLYYIDKDNNPSYFTTGFFSCLDYKRPYIGNFNYNNLLPGYKKENEKLFKADKLDISRKYLNECKDLKNIEALFLGDSYFEFWHYRGYTLDTFERVFPSNFINIGIGGSTYLDWISYLKKLKKEYKITPKKIVVNLGFNDIHCGRDLKSILDNFKKVNDLLVSINPKAKIYYLTHVHAPDFIVSYKRQEDEFYKMFTKYAKENDIKFIDTYQKFNEIYDKLKNKDDYAKYFNNDKVHLSTLGYKILETSIKEAI